MSQIHVAPTTADKLLPNEGIGQGHELPLSNIVVSGISDAGMYAHQIDTTEPHSPSNVSKKSSNFLAYTS
jgi:hypothetical protein